MKVLWLSHLVPYPPSGGAPQRSYHLLRQAARRHDVTLMSFNQRALLGTTAELDGAVAHLAPWCAGVSTYPIPSDRSVLLRYLGLARAYLTAAPYEAHWLASDAMKRDLGRLSGRAAFDLVHVDTLGLFPYTALLPTVPVVLTHHDVQSHLFRRRLDHERRWMHRVYLRREVGKLVAAERRWTRAATLNVTVSSLDATRLRETAGDVAVEVVENGVDVEYFRPSAGAGRGLVFAGSLGTYPNRDAVGYLLREIWPLLAGDADWTLTLVGRDPPPEACRASARDPHVTVTGRVADVRPHIAAGAIYVCPLRIGGGTRLKVLDALAMAKPLVATRLAVEGLSLIPGEHYLPAESPQDFVREIRRLAGDPELAARLGGAGRRLVEATYSWDVIGARLDGAYRRAAASSRSTFHAPIASAARA